jgi:hypothetical protein
MYSSHKYFDTKNGVSGMERTKMHRIGCLVNPIFFIKIWNIKKYKTYGGTPPSQWSLCSKLLTLLLLSTSLSISYSKPS